MIFDAIQNHDPDRIALSDHENSIRYGDLAIEVDTRARMLRGVSVLGIALDNGVDWVLWDLAALKSGVPCVPVPPFFTKEQVNHLLHAAGVTHLLSPEGMRDTGIAWSGLLHEGTSKVTFTSGTTGTPKGVCLPAAAMENVADSIVKVIGPGFVGTHVSVLPFAVLLENIAGVYAGLVAGCNIHIPGLSSFGTDYSGLHGILKHRCAHSVILVPEILRLLMAQIVRAGPLPDLKFVAVGGSKIDPALITVARTMGLPVYEGYGLSECASVVALNTPDSDRPGCVGKILPHLCAHVIDGEICISNPGFLGYVGEIAPAVFHTGDLGTLGDDQFLSVTGRRKNVLITSYGRNVSPEWVESLALTQPEIAQIIVYGDAQPNLSALVVPASQVVNIQSAIDRTNFALPDYAHIKDFQIVRPFTVTDETLTGTGRPRRDKIMNLYGKGKSDELLRSTG